MNYAFTSAVFLISVSVRMDSRHQTQFKLKIIDHISNRAVQYVPMCDFCWFFHRLSPLVRPFFDCYGGWQMFPVAISVGTVYFKTQICLGLCVSACSLGSIHPLTHASPPLTSPSQEMTGECNPPQSLFCSLNPPQPSDTFRCGYHLPVSRSHVVSSKDLVSQTEELLASGAEGDTYSTVKATTATCGAYNKD